MAGVRNNKPGMVAALLIVVLLLVFIMLRRNGKHGNISPGAATGHTSQQRTETGLIRHPFAIHYSHHARCRMQCRHIDESEVLEILAGGTINYRKSELENAACNRRYAVEGRTRDGQQVRIIFAPCKQEETVVTVIDIGQEWPCDCK